MDSYGEIRSPSPMHGARLGHVDLAQERASALDMAQALIAQALSILDREDVPLAAAYADMCRQIVAREQAKELARP